MIKNSVYIFVLFCFSLKAEIQIANETPQKMTVITMKGVEKTTSFTIPTGITATITYCPDVLLFSSEDRKLFGNQKPKCNAKYQISLDGQSLHIIEVP